MTMAENAEREPDIAAIFKDSGDEGRFYGYGGSGSDNDSDSDVDRVGLEDDGGGPAPGNDTEDEE